jgi:hypothetical protein
MLNSDMLNSSVSYVKIVLKSIISNRFMQCILMLNLKFLYCGKVEESIKKYKFEYLLLN